MKLIHIAALLALLVMPALARADEESHRIAVQDFFKTTNAEETYAKSLEAMIDLQIKGNPQLAPMRGVMLEFFNEYVSWDKVLPQLITLYMETFSEEEIKLYTAFFSTPEGKKWSANQTDIFSKSAQIGQAEVTRNMAKLQEMIAQEFMKIQQKAGNAAGNGAEAEE